MLLVGLPENTQTFSQKDFFEGSILSDDHSDFDSVCASPSHNIPNNLHTLRLSKKLSVCVSQSRNRPKHLEQPIQQDRESVVCGNGLQTVAGVNSCAHGFKVPLHPRDCLQDNCKAGSCSLACKQSQLAIPSGSKTSGCSHSTVSSVWVRVESGQNWPCAQL